MNFRARWTPLLLTAVLLATLQIGCSELDSILNNDGKESAPADPSNLTVALQESDLLLIWQDNSTDEEGFSIEIQEDYNQWAQLAQVEPNNTSFLFQSFEIGVQYNFRVYAYKGSTTSGYSNPVNFSVSPDSPNNLQISNSGSNWVEMTWEDPSELEQGFRVERSEDNGASWNSIADLEPNTTSYTDNNLPDGSSYLYHVLANYGTSFSSASNTVSFVAVLSPPGNFGIVDSGESWISFKWDDPSSSEQGFRIERSEGTGSTWTVLASVDADCTSYTDESVNPGVDYAYRIFTIGDNAESDPSSTVYTATYLYAPSNLNAEVDNSGNSPTVTLTWIDNSSAEDGFTVERKTDVTGWTAISTLGADITRYVDAAPGLDAVNYYRIKATTEYTSSDYSNEVNVSVAAPLTLQIVGETGFEGMTVNYFPQTDGGLSWVLLDRNATNMGVFVTDSHKYEGSQGAMIVDWNGSVYANVKLSHQPLSGRVRTEMMTYCGDADRVANLVGVDTDGTELFNFSFWWSGNFQYYDGAAWVDTGIAFPTATWFNLAIEVDTNTNLMWVYVDGNPILSEIPFMATGNGTYDGTIFKMPLTAYMPNPIYIDNVKVGYYE